MPTPFSRLLFLGSISLAGFACPTRTIYYDAGTTAGGGAAARTTAGSPEVKLVADEAGVLRERTARLPRAWLAAISKAGGSPVAHAS